MYVTSRMSDPKFCARIVIRPTTVDIGVFCAPVDIGVFYAPTIRRVMLPPPRTRVSVGNFRRQRTKTWSAGDTDRPPANDGASTPRGALPSSPTSVGLSGASRRSRPSREEEWIALKEQESSALATAGLERRRRAREAQMKREAAASATALVKSSPDVKQKEAASATKATELPSIF